MFIFLAFHRHRYFYHANQAAKFELLTVSTAYSSAVLPCPLEVCFLTVTRLADWVAEPAGSDQTQTVRRSGGFQDQDRLFSLLPRKRQQQMLPLTAHRVSGETEIGLASRLQVASAAGKSERKKKNNPCYFQS